MRMFNDEHERSSKNNFSYSFLINIGAWSQMCVCMTTQLITQLIHVATLHNTYEQDFKMCDKRRNDFDGIHIFKFCCILTYDEYVHRNEKHILSLACI